MNQPIFLAIDTSTAQISVAIGKGDQVLAEENKIDALRHAELASDLIKTVLDKAQLTIGEIDIYLCGIGPGPFTGLRVGVVTAQMLALVNQKPLYGICSHDAIAMAQTLGAEFTVITDARRKEVYATQYLGQLRTHTPLVKKRELINAPLIVEDQYPLAKNLIKQAQYALAKGEDLEVKDFILDAADQDGSKVKLPQNILLPSIPLYLRVPDAKAAHD